MLVLIVYTTEYQIATIVDSSRLLISIFTSVMVSLLIKSFMKSVMKKFKTTSLAINHLFTRLNISLHNFTHFTILSSFGPCTRITWNKNHHSFCYRSYFLHGDYNKWKSVTTLRSNFLTRKLRLPKFSKYAHKSHFTWTCMFHYWNLEAVAEWRIPYSNLAISHQPTESSCAIMAGKSNMELMLQDENRIPSFLFKWWNPVIVTAIGVATVFVLRYSQRRPLISGT